MVSFGRISTNSFLSFILLVVVVIVVVILIVVVVAIVGVVIVVAVIGVVVVVAIVGVVIVVAVIGVVVVVVVGSVSFIIKLSFMVIGFLPSDLISFFYSNRLGKGIPPEQSFPSEGTNSKSHFVLLGTFATRKYRFSPFKLANKTNSSVRTIEVEKLVTCKLL
ncbi:hypothetical protein Tco_1564880, partial [Tanacetum coccineum]